MATKKKTKAKVKAVKRAKKLIKQKIMKPRNIQPSVGVVEDFEYRSDNAVVRVTSSSIYLTVNGTMQVHWDRDTASIVEETSFVDQPDEVESNSAFEGQFAKKENFDDVEANSTEDRAGSPDISAAQKTNDFEKR